MISIPLPFLLAAVLAVLLSRLILHGTSRRSPWLIGLLALMMIQMILVGLRWGLDASWLHYALPITAAGIPPLAYLCFDAMRAGGSNLDRFHRLMLPAAPAVTIVLATLFAPDTIDFLLFLNEAAFGLALLALVRRGPDILGDASIDGALPAFRALQFMAFLTLLMAPIDLAISSDLLLFHGAHVGMVVSGGMLVILASMGFAATLAQSVAAPQDADEEPQPRSPSDEDRQVLETLVRALDTHMLYQDPNLTLNRLARRCLIPARRISEAVNRLTQKNVSQFVNEHRIREACRHLVTSGTPITEIMLATGFQTKSNFNREFRRVTGVNPSEYRKAKSALSRPGEDQDD